MDSQALGRYLRETREARELTLDDAEQTLHIRKRVLESFELGEFLTSGASDIQVRGFLRNYALYLGIDEERVIQHYDAALIEDQRQQRRKSKRGKRDTQSRLPVSPRAITDTNPTLPKVSASALRPARSLDRLFSRLVIALVGLAAFAVIVFVALQLIQQNPTPGLELPAPDILAQLPGTVTFTRAPTLTPAVTATVSANISQVYTGQGVLVTMETTQRTWLRVVADGIEQYVGIAPPGTVREFAAAQQIVITASNAEALQVIYNGRQQGLFGGRGQKVDIVFTVADLEVSSGPGFEPTPEFSPTPLPTSDLDVGALIAQLTPTATDGPSPTPTDTPTITLTPSITPTPSDTPTATYTPSITPLPSVTPTASDTPPPSLTPTITPTPSATAVLPPRVTQENLPPTKEGL